MLSCKQHYQSINSEAQSTSRRHPILHSNEKILVHTIKILIAVQLTKRLLFLESPSLILRIIQFSKGIGNFHASSKSLEPFDRIVRRDLCDGADDMGIDAGPGNLRRAGGYAEGAGAAYIARPVGRRQQRLGWHAAGIQAVAAHGATFDEDRIGAKLGGHRGNGKPARSGADDTYVRLDRFWHRE